jgi:hypothetical protein
VRYPSPSIVILAVLAVASIACSESRTGGPRVVVRGDGSIGATDASPGDASSIDDRGAMIEDSGSTIDDRGSTIDDRGMIAADSGGDVDSSTAEDAGADLDAEPPNSDASTSMGVCADLLACCGSLPPQLQGQCMTTASSGDAAQCMMILQLAQQVGVCMGPPATDAGARDVGPLGPACSDYLACCPTLGPLQMSCETTAMNGNEATCAQNLSAVQQAGFCGGDASIPSFDASFPFDGNFPFDASFPPSDASTRD